MTIAVIKGTLVVLFFMDVRRASSMTKLFVVAGFFWMAILLVFVLSDYSAAAGYPVANGGNSVAERALVCPLPYGRS